MEDVSAIEPGPCQPIDQPMTPGLATPHMVLDRPPATDTVRSVRRTIGTCNRWSHSRFMTNEDRNAIYWCVCGLLERGVLSEREAVKEFKAARLSRRKLSIVYHEYKQA